MTQIRRSSWRKRLRLLLRRGLAMLPREARFSLFRQLVDCDPTPDPRLTLKIAETREELEACFEILHDAYVAAGFMQPHPSGLRVTVYHALPTTTTLCAKWDGRVVGTISMIRDGVFGFPLQSIFDLADVRSREGQIAEISALAVHPDFRKTGGAILFPLMKFMYEYCRAYFDTRHLVIAVNPDRIEMYESLLFFERLQEQVVGNYDFANGAPAVGATLDLRRAPELFKREYGRRKPRKNLYQYFTEVKLPNIELPKRRYFTTNDPVMTPELLDHFFNQRTQTFEQLDDRKKALLWSIYQVADYRRVLPMLADGEVPAGHPLRRFQRHSIRCPAELRIPDGQGGERRFVVTVVELSLGGFQARSSLPLPIGSDGLAHVELGAQEHSKVQVQVVRQVASDAGLFFGLRLAEPDGPWQRCVAAMESHDTSSELNRA
jgi:GNAT superfamily N-acetyltransferase